MAGSSRRARPPKSQHPEEIEPADRTLVRMEPMVEYKSTLNRKEIDLFLDAEESPEALMKGLLDRVLLCPATPPLVRLVLAGPLVAASSTIRV